MDRWEPEARRAKRRGDVREQGGEPQETALEITPGGLTRSGSNYSLDRRVGPTCFSMRDSSDVLKFLLHWFKERKLA